MNDETPRVNLNTADLDELQRLPGVGPAMAERILAARPFDSIEDLQRVSGIGASVLENIRRFLLPLESESEPLKMEAQEAEAQIEAEPAGPELLVEGEPKAATQSQAFWISVGFSFLALVIAFGLSLGFLALVNGGLRYANPAQVDALRRQVDGLSAQAEFIQQDLNGLRTRVDELEGLSGRVGEVEKAAAQLRSDMNEAASSIEQLTASMAELTTSVEELQSRTNRFENFLNGLRELLSGLFESE